MTLRELAAELQALCYEGYSECEVAVRISGRMYGCGDVTRVGDVFVVDVPQASAAGEV